MMRLAGSVAAGAYLVAVILGGVLVPGYSHLSQAISELVPLSEGTATVVLELLFGLYNLFVVIFGVLVVVAARTPLHRAVGLLLAVVGLLGGMIAFFPMDLVGSQPTTAGVIHLVLAGLLAPMTLALALLGAVGARGNRSYRVVSLVCFAMILVFGPLAAASAANLWPIMGLLERLTIGAFIFWVLVSALVWGRGREGAARTGLPKQTQNPNLEA